MRLGLPVLFVIAACGPSHAVTGVHTHYFADNHDLENQTTYALVEAQVPDGFYDEHHSEMFGAAHDQIHDEMQNRGRTETGEEEAELIVSYTVGGRSHPVETVQFVGSPVGVPLAFDAHEEKMVIVVFERESGNKVFEASYDHLIEEGNPVEENERLIRSVVTRLFSEFPQATAAATPAEDPSAEPTPAEEAAPEEAEEAEDVAAEEAPAA